MRSYKGSKELRVGALVFIVFIFLILWAVPGFANRTGDVNGDGQVDILDVRLCYQFALGLLVLTPEQQAACDINEDGHVTVEDAKQLAAYIVGLSSIPATTKVLDTATTAALGTVDANGIKFSRSTSLIDSLRPGDIVVCGVTAKTPYGLLRKVDRVARGPGGVTVKTSPARLVDAVNQGSIDVRHKLTIADIASTTTAPGVSMRMLPKSTGGISYSLTAVLYDGDGNYHTTDDQITTTGTLSITPEFLFALQIGRGGIEHVSFKTVVTEQAALKVGGEVSLMSCQYSKELWRQTFTPIVVFIGFVPVVLVPVLTVDVDVTGNVTVGLSAGVTQQASFTAGVSYDYGHWSLIKDFTNNFDYQTPTISASCNVRGAATPELGLLIYGLVGPYANVEGYLDFTANPSEQPWWKLWGGLSVHAGVKFDALGYVVSYESPELAGYHQLLAHANIPPTASFTANPTNGVAPLQVYFDATRSSDSDGSIASYKWNFGDGSSGSGSTTNHVYQNAGTYTAQLTVTDNGGASDKQSVQITVTQPAQKGAISGSVKDAVTQAPLSGVSVKVLNNSLVAQGFTNGSGNYLFDVPVGSGYSVVFTKTGYLSATYHNVAIAANSTTYLEAVLIIDTAHSGPGNVSGTIRDAVTGTGVGGLTVSLRTGIHQSSGPIVATTSSAPSGFYSFSSLAAGYYTAEVSGAGYNTTYFTVLCVGGETTANQDAVVTPTIASGVVRIVLTWGLTPHDLDSHLTGPLPDGTRFHLFYPYAETNYGSPWPEYVKLDRDDTTSYGPETTTIYKQIAGVYRFSVHDYSDRWSTHSFALSNSGAQVKVYRGSSLIKVFNVPAGQEGTLWTVFEMSGNTIIPVNTMTYESSPASVRGLLSETDGELMRHLPAKGK